MVKLLLPATATVTNGVGSASITLKTAGSQTVTCADSITSTIAGTSSGITVLAAATARFVVTGLPPDVPALTPVNFTVTAEDQFGNFTPGFSGIVHFVSSDSHAVLPANTPLTAGVGVFTATFHVPGSQTITASSQLSNAASFVQAPSSPFQVPIPNPFATQIDVADFNGDGKPDLLVLDTSDNEATVLLGNGNGTFSPSNYFIPIGGPSVAATVGDFNGDGNMDLVLRYNALPVIEVLLGNGNGTFQQPLTFATLNSPMDIVTGDFSNDGKLDLAFIDAAGEIEVMLGNGNGTFGPPIAYTTAGPNAGNLVVGDFNNDGNLDLVFGRTNGTNVRILLGNGNGTFMPPSGIATVINPTYMVAGDFNGDGNLDLAIANEVAGNVYELLGNGDGSFAAPTTIDSIDAGLNGLAAADVTGDGELGLVLTGPYTDALYVLAGNGDGTFAMQTVALGFSPQTIAVGDFNGDGLSDLAISSRNSPTISILLNAAPVGSASVAVEPVADHFLVSGGTATAIAGSPVQFTLTAEDYFDNTFPTFSGTVHLTTSDNQALLPADATLTNGVGTFTVTFKTAGTQTVTTIDSLDTGLAGTSQGVTVAAAAATHLAVSAPPAAVAAIAIEVTVTALDQFNNVVAGYGGTVHFTSTDSAASLPTDATLAGGIGILNATLNTDGNQTVTATDIATATITGSSGAIAVTGTSTHLAVYTPADVTANTPFIFTVTAEDASGNTATSYNGTVAVTSTNSAAVLPTNTTLTNGSGTFTATVTARNQSANHGIRYRRQQYHRRQ